MAHGAIGGEARGHVIGVFGSGKVRLVAAVAGSGQRCVVVVGMARGTGHRCVSPGQRERGVVVIESRRCPRGRVMASFARSREAR